MYSLSITAHGRVNCRLIVGDRVPEWSTGLNVFFEVMLGAKLIRSELANIRLAPLDSIKSVRRLLKKVIQKGSSQQLRDISIHNRSEVY